MLDKYKIKTGVVGVGSMGQNHARIYSEISNLVAVSDSDSKQGKKIADRFGVEFFENYRDMFDKVEAISIAVPTTLHLEVAQAALRSGVNVLVEKPLASTVEESIKIINTSKEMKKVLSVAFSEITINSAPVLSPFGIMNEQRYSLSSFRATST